MHNIPASKLQHSLVEALKRTAVPFAIFSAVLALLMALSWALLLPMLTRIDVLGTLHTLDALDGIRTELEEQIRDAESRRAQSLLSVQDPRYHALLKKRWDDPSPLALRARLREVAQGVIQQNDAVHISGLSWDPADRSFIVTGDVRFVGPRSMTVLAEFIDAIKEAPEFVVAAMPRFLREEAPGVGLHSPFTLSLKIR